MAIKYQGSGKFTYNLDVQAQKPLDSRLVVASYENDLAGEKYKQTFVLGGANAWYDGMLVYAEDTKRVYVLQGDPADGGKGFVEVGSDLIADAELSDTTYKFDSATVAGKGTDEEGNEIDIEVPVESGAYFTVTEEGKDPETIYVNADVAGTAAQVKTDLLGGEETYTTLKKAGDALRTLNGSDKTVGSVAYAVAQEAERAKGVEDTIKEMIGAGFSKEHDVAKAISDVATSVTTLANGAVATNTGDITTLKQQVAALTSATHFAGKFDSLELALAAVDAKGDIVIVGNKEYIYSADVVEGVEKNVINFVELGDTTAEAEAITALGKKIDDEITEVSQVTAAALNDLNTRLNAADTKERVDVVENNTAGEKVITKQTVNGVTTLTAHIANEAASFKSATPNGGDYIATAYGVKDYVDNVVCWQEGSF